MPKAVLLVPWSNEDIVTATELASLCNKNDVDIQVIPDDQFNVQFDIGTETVSLEISDETFLTLAKLAQRKNVTFDQLLNSLLKAQLQKTTPEA